MLFKIQRFLIIFLLISIVGSAQHKSDTAILIKELNKVMSFSVQPFLHYNSTTTMETLPVIGLNENIAVLHSRFYKMNNNFYFGNEQQEIYLQDSLMITVVHPRKSIQVSKVDMATKPNMDIMPLKNIVTQQMLRKNYSVGRGETRGDTGVIILQAQGQKQANTSEMLVEYDKKYFIPFLIKLSIFQLQLVSEPMLEQLTQQGKEFLKLITVKDGLQYLEMKQTITLRFSDIDTKKEAVSRIPDWQEQIIFDQADQLFKGKGKCEDYSVIKTF